MCMWKRSMSKIGVSQMFAKDLTPGASTSPTQLAAKAQAKTLCAQNDQE